jgi:hypothetical protein
VTESLGDLLKADITTRQTASKRVPEVMRSESPCDAREFLRKQERAADSAWREPLPIRVDEDENACHRLCLTRTERFAASRRDRDLRLEFCLLRHYPDETSSEVNGRPCQVAQICPRAKPRFDCDDEELPQFVEPREVRTRCIAVAAHPAAEAALRPEVLARLHGPKLAARTDVTPEPCFVVEGSKEPCPLVHLEFET